MTKEFQMLAKTFKGLEQVLAKELIELGANNVQIERRAVSFTGDMRMLYTANFCLRTASRVLVPIATFKAKKTDDIYEQVKLLPKQVLQQHCTTLILMKKYKRRF